MCMPAPIFSIGYGMSRRAGVAIFSGRNRGKIDRIIAALEAGLHVLADKPAIIEPADLQRLEAALTLANEQQLVLADMMTGRHNTLVRVLQALRRDPEVFGDPLPGTGDEPGILLSGVHYLRKVVAGLPTRVPPGISMSASRVRVWPIPACIWWIGCTRCCFLSSRSTGSGTSRSLPRAAGPPR